MLFQRKKTALPLPHEALPGRAEPIVGAMRHAVTGVPLQPPFPAGTATVLFGMGCFWGAERKFWQMGDGIVATAVGYTAGLTPNPTYEEVCSGLTGHNEVVLVAFDPARLPLARLLALFWESHNPTQGMRQGNDTGTQYRSGIYLTTAEQKAEAIASRDAYGAALSKAGHGTITTEILDAPIFYYAEAYHQQYLHKNPNGYCGLNGTGVSCPIGTSIAA